jgi:hypothetical protein
LILKKKKLITESVEAKLSHEVQVDNPITADARVQSPINKIKAQIQLEDSCSANQAHGHKASNIEFASVPAGQADNSAARMPSPSVDLSAAPADTDQSPDVETLTPAIWSRFFLLSP